MALTEVEVGAEASVPYRIQIGDTDASGRIHWGSVFGMFELAEVALWRSLGQMELYLELPRISANVSYRRALAFDNEVIVHARLERLGETSLTIGFRISLTGEEAVTASVTAVHVDDQGQPKRLRQ